MALRMERGGHADHHRSLRRMSVLHRRTASIPPLTHIRLIHRISCAFSSQSCCNALYYAHQRLARLIAWSNTANVACALYAHKRKEVTQHGSKKESGKEVRKEVRP
jgi:hypothetical protein